MIMAGIDEAGLGPTLGPLATAATAFEVPEAWEDNRPWREWDPPVGKDPGSHPGLLVADSKIAHRVSGVAGLELTLAAFASCRGANHPDFLFSGFPDGRLPPGRYPWHSGSLLPFPCHVPPEQVAKLASQLTLALEKSGSRVAHLEVSLLNPGELNQRYAEGLNKNAALLLETGAHLQKLARLFAGENLRVTIDKQGGRNDYLPFLTRLFPGAWIDCLQAGALESTYRLHLEAGKPLVTFQPRADGASFSTALASQLAKYARERAMAELNSWFGARLPGLKPSAGYPLDARRWLSETAVFRQNAGIPPELIQRSR
jgi:hypothetical protein